MDDINSFIKSLQNTIGFQEIQLKHQEAQLKGKDEKIAILLEVIRLQHLRNYASRSEKNKTPNGDIFNADEQEPELAEATTIAEYVRNKPKRKKLPDNVPRVYIDVDVSEADKTCRCGCQLTPIGEVTSEQYDIIPEVVQILCYVRKKYACKHCQQTVKTAPLPAQPIPKSNASPGLLAHVMVSKFCDHLPLYRQEQILKRGGIDLSRAVLSQWVITCGKLFQPLINLLQEQHMQYDVGYCDETPVQVLKEKDRKPESKSYMWVFAGGTPETFSWIYRYEPSRSGAIPLAFWEGFKGYLHVDGYVGYHKLAETGSIHLVNCMAHGRRNFSEIAKLSKKPGGVSNAVLGTIGKLYQIEKRLKQNQASVDSIKSARQEQSKPILDKLKQYLEEKQASTLPNSALGKAIAYMLNHWIGLTRYLEDGRLEIDNNRSERAIKPFATGRKNWLFCDSVRGANASANIYSLIETCKHHQVNPYDYLKFVLTEINKCQTVEDYEKLLPYHFNSRAIDSSG